jgi:hypothetical protein
MKKSLLLIASMILTFQSFSQIAFMQYRHVPADKNAEFVERETKYWSQVAKAAIDQGHMLGWALWRKVGVTHSDHPNYVFVNLFESADKMDQSKVWSNENLQKLGADPEDVETNSFTTIPFTYYMQLEDMIDGEYSHAVVNYATPEDRTAFIEENKNLWKPLHEQNIKNGTNAMTSWGLMSTITPSGNNARFSCLTWDGFNSLADALNYLSYQSPDLDGSNDAWAEVVSKSKMSEIMPDGFEYRIIYELVMSVGGTGN